MVGVSGPGFGVTVPGSTVGIVCNENNLPRLLQVAKLLMLVAEVET